jgi:hypothetical protein
MIGVFYSPEGTEHALLELRQAKQVMKAPGLKEPGVFLGRVL